MKKKESTMPAEAAIFPERTDALVDMPFCGNYFRGQFLNLLAETKLIQHAFFRRELGYKCLESA